MLLPVAAILSTTTSSNSGACTQQPNCDSNSYNNICDRRKRSASALNANCCSCTLTLATVTATATAAAGVRLDWDANEGRRWAQRRRRKRRKFRCNERTNNSNQHSDVKTAAGNYTNIGRKAAATTRALRNLTNIVVIIKRRRRQVRRRSRKSGSGSERIANCISCWMLPQASVTKRLETATTTTVTSSSIATALIENAAATATTTKIVHTTTSSGKANDETLATATTVKHQQHTQHQSQAQPKQNQLKQQQQQQQPVVKAEHLTIKQVSSAAEKHKTQQQKPQQQQSTTIPTKIAQRKFDYLIACSRATTPAARTNTTTTTIATTTTTTTKVKRHTNHFGSTPFSAACTLLFGALFALSHALQTSTASGLHTSQNMQNSQVLHLQHHRNSNSNNNNNNNNDSYNMSANEYNGRHSMPLEIPMDVMNSSSNSSSSSDVGHNNNNYGNNNNTFKSLSIIDGLAAETETNQLPAFDFGMPRNITARTGQTEAIIKCRVDRLDDKSVSWIRKRDLHILTVGTATYTSDKRFQVTESKDSREWTLHVKAPQARDSGIYECQVNTEPKVSMAFQLNIIEISPDSRAIISGPADLHFKVGSAIILSCHVQQPSVKDIGPIYWYRGEYIITPFDADAVDDGGGGGGSSDGGRANTAIAGTGTATVAAAAADAAMQHDDIATNDITQDFTTRIAMESQLGDTLKSRLRISNAQTTDTGNYTCQPTTASSASVMVHVINDENPAAMQKSSANALYKLPAATTITATTILLTTITLMAKATSARTLQTAALIANTCRRLYSKHRCQPHCQQQQQCHHEEQQQRLHIVIAVIVVVVVVVIIIAGTAAAAANLETAMAATVIVAVISAVAASSQVGKRLVATLLIVAATVTGVLVVAIVSLSSCDVALLMSSPLHALLALLAVPLFVVSASRIILR